MTREASGSHRSAVLAEFAQRVLEDLEAGTVQSLAAYQARFPGWEAAIADEYEQLLGDAAEPTGVLHEARAEDPDEARREAGILGALMADAEAGRARSLADYCRLFPDDEVLVARVLAERQPLLSRRASGSGEGGEGPRQIGPYQLLNEIGRGGQGVVWLAEDSRLGRKVALKVLRTSGLVSSNARRRFRREAELASRLEDPGICTVYETDLDGELPYLAMQWIEGSSLASRFAQMPGAPDRAERQRRLELLTSVARSLHVAHEAGIVHRDLKPANLLLPPNGPPVIVDFGLAALEDAEGSSLTETEGFLGTLPYTSPEQIAGTLDRPDRRTDIFALGVILYEAVAGRRPFTGPTRQALMREIAEGSPPPLGRLVPGVPADLVAIVEVALEKDPQRRYATTEALADDLEALVSGQAVSVKRRGLISRSLRWSRHHPAAALLLIALPLVAGLSGYLLATRSQVEAGRDALARRALDGHVDAGYVALGERRLRRAEDEFRRAVALAPDNLLARGGLGLVRLIQERFEAAREALGTAGSTDELSPIMVRVLDRLGRSEEAKALRERYPAHKSPLGLYFEARFILLGSNGNDQEAARRALDMVDRLLLRTPRIHRLFLATRLYAAHQARDQQAIDDTAAALTLRWPESAAAWYDAAWGLRHFDLKRGLEAIEECLRLDPGQPSAHSLRGEILVSLWRLDDAEAALERSWQLDPTQPFPAFSLGEILKRAGRFDEARAWFDKGLSLTPDNGMAWHHMAQIHMIEGRLSEATSALRHSWKLRRRSAPESPEEPPHLARFLDLERRVRRIRAGEVHWTGESRQLTAEAQAAYLSGHNLTAVELLESIEEELPHPEYRGEWTLRHALARATMRAGFGEGPRASRLGSAECKALRERCLEALTAEIEYWCLRHERQRLRDADLHVVLFSMRHTRFWDWVRPRAEACRLPPEERPAWRALWTRLDEAIDEVAP